MENNSETIDIVQFALVDEILSALNSVTTPSEEDGTDKREIRIRFTASDYFKLFPTAKRNRREFSSLVKSSKIAEYQEECVHKLTPLFVKDWWLQKVKSKGEHRVGVIRQIKFSLMQKIQRDPNCDVAITVATWLCVRFSFTTITLENPDSYDWKQQVDDILERDVVV
jgi:hypothetical protein